MIEIDVEQGSPEWRALRLGVLTASNFSKVLAKGEGKTRRSLMLDLITEMLTGLPSDGFESEWTLRGTELEPEARSAYELETGNQVRRVGFVIMDDSGRIGSSPDGLIGDHCGLELKCPKPRTHIEYLLGGKLPSTYVAQVQGNMMVTGRSHWEFASYCPEVTGNPLFVVPVVADPEYINNLKNECAKFVAELDKLMKEIKS